MAEKRKRKQGKCADCGKSTSRPSSIRCRSCSKTGNLNIMKIKGGHSAETKLKFVKAHKTRDKSTYTKGFQNISSEVRKSYYTKRSLNWNKKTEEEKSRLLEPFLKAGLENCRKSSKTSIEIKVANFLNTLKLDFIQNQWIGRYNVDIIVNNYIIECYGDYWHCNPKLYKSDFYNKSLRLTSQEKWDRDNIRNSILNKKGYKILTFWEDDIKNNFDYVTNTIKQCVI